MALVKGNCFLRITSIRNTGSATDRYNAKVVDPLQAVVLGDPERPLGKGQEVTVKFRNKENPPEVYLSKEARFDGVDNDIQILENDNPVEPNRSGATHTIPESLLKSIDTLEPLPPVKEEFPMQEIYQLFKTEKQIILQGAPGVGKTYTTKELAVKIIDGDSGDHPERETIITRYKDVVKNGQIVFSTFHQSMDYEDFIEGYKPSKDGDGSFILQAGPFKKICEKAIQDSNKNYVLIIDEINRGNRLVLTRNMRGTGLVIFSCLWPLLKGGGGRR
jgi:hypothetical protein